MVRRIRKFFDRFDSQFLNRLGLKYHIYKKTKHLVNNIQLLDFTEEYIQIQNQHKNCRKERYYVGPVNIGGHVENIFKFWHEWNKLKKDIFCLLGIKGFENEYSDLMHISWEQGSIQELEEMLKLYAPDWSYVRLIKADSNIFYLCKYYINMLKF